MRVLGSKPKRQAVINVSEDKRVVTHEVNIVVRKIGLDVKDDEMPKVNEFLRSKFIQTFPVDFPNPDSVRYRITNLRNADPPSKMDTYRRFTATVTATVPESKMAFLVGFDESDLFISMLPEQATSVKHAHELLRPEGVDNRSIRQGEWFFQPVDDEKIIESLDKKVAEDPEYPERFFEISDDKGESTHYAMTVRLKKKQYTIGWVTDYRWDRSSKVSHHAPLFLTHWHEIIRNLELEPPDNMQGSGRSWD